jgi:hypothetical protein
MVVSPQWLECSDLGHLVDMGLISLTRDLCGKQWGKIGEVN